jgi:hypothetical protein
MDWCFKHLQLELHEASTKAKLRMVPTNVAEATCGATNVYRQSYRHPTPELQTTTDYSTRAGRSYKFLMLELHNTASVYHRF